MPSNNIQSGDQSFESIVKLNSTIDPVLKNLHKFIQTQHYHKH